MFTSVLHLSLHAISIYPISDYQALVFPGVTYLEHTGYQTLSLIRKIYTEALKPKQRNTSTALSTE